MYLYYDILENASRNVKVGSPGLWALPVVVCQPYTRGGHMGQVSGVVLTGIWKC